MLPQIMLILGLILALMWFVNPLLPILGVTLLLAGIVLWRQIYDRGNVLYWEWMRRDENWKIASEKRQTVLARIANKIEEFSGFEGNLLRDMSADRSAAGFLMESFPNIETMSALRGLYDEVVAVERDINQMRIDAARWNKEVQQIGTDAWFNRCLPGYLRARLNPILRSPQGDLAPESDDGLADIQPHQW